MEPTKMPVRPTRAYDPPLKKLPQIGRPADRKHRPDRRALEAMVPATRGTRATLSRLPRDVRWRPRERTGGRAPALIFALIAVSVLASAACGGAERTRAGAVDGPDATAQEHPSAAENGGDERSVVSARQAEVSAAAGAKARSGGAMIPHRDAAGKTGSIGAGKGREVVTLRIAGESGTAFSGACSVGNRERPLDGQVPKRYVFEPRGKKVTCEVRKGNGGTLGVIFTNGAGVRAEQRTGAGESTTRFAYHNGSVSSSTSSAVAERNATSSVVTSSDDLR